MPIPDERDCRVKANMMRKQLTRTAGAIATGFVLTTCTPIAAQEVGNHVRVTIGGDVLTGDVVETSDAGFTLALSEVEIAQVLSREVERLEVRTCCAHGVWAVATVVGAATGGLLEGYLRGNVECRTGRPLFGIGGEHETCEVSPRDTLLGSLVGGVAGFAVGRKYLRYSWTTVPTPNGSGLEVSPWLRCDPGTGTPG